MPTPKDSIVRALLAPSSQLSPNVHTTCPPQPPPWRSERISRPENYVDQSHTTPGLSESSAETEESESSTPMDLTNNNPPPPKMPGVVDETDEWVSASSSSDSSELSSAESASTEQPAQPDRSPPPPPAPMQEDIVRQDVVDYADDADDDYDMNDALRLELPRVWSARRMFIQDWRLTVDAGTSIDHLLISAPLQQIHGPAAVRQANVPSRR